MSDKEPSKFCKDCKWSEKQAGLMLCSAPGNGLDIVTGEVKVVLCLTNRANWQLGSCYTKAILFESKEVKPETTLFCKVINLFKKD